MPTGDPADLDAAELGLLLSRLTDEERRLSRRRTTLQQRIDFLAGGGYAHLDASAEQLTTLRQEERSVSAERHALHQTIAAARAVEAERRRANGGPAESRAS